MTSSPPEQTPDQAYAIARRYLPAAQALVTAHKASGLTGGDLAAELGAALVRVAGADPFALGAMAAVVLLELDQAKADLAAVEDVAADARSHWPADRVITATKDTEGLTLGGFLGRVAEGREIARRGREHVEAQSVWDPNTLAAVAAGWVPPAGLVPVPALGSALAAAQALDIAIGREHAAGDHRRCDLEQCAEAGWWTNPEGRREGPLGGPSGHRPDSSIAHGLGECLTDQCTGPHRVLTDRPRTVVDLDLAEAAAEGQS